MIVICPNCGTRYKMPEGMALAGKRMRCAECDHRWVLAASDEDDELAVAQQILRDQPAEPEPTPSAMADPEVPADTQEHSQDDITAATDEAESDESEPPEKPSHYLRWIFSLVAASVLAVLAGAIWLEKIDAARIPLIGQYLTQIQPGPSKLSITLDARLSRMDSGKTMLEVNGVIHNNDTIARSLGPLKATLAGNSGVLRRWIINPPVAELEAGGETSFSSTLADVPDQRFRVQVIGS